jgi:hypothetical protein
LQSLFANGENGFLFDAMSDLTRLFTTSLGPTNVAANNDPVGLLLDRSKRAGKTLAQVIASQPDLAVNGGFDTDSNWTKQAGWTIAGGKASRTASGEGTSIIANGAVVVAPGKTYRIEFTVLDYVAGTVQSALSAVGGATRSANGTYIDYITAQSAGGVSFYGSAAFVGSIDAVSMREIPGNHALTATPAQRPFWKANSGKDYLQPDRFDDRLVTPFIPTAAVTLACAVRFSAGVDEIVMGGGVSTGNHRCFIGRNAITGAIDLGWGEETIGADTYGPDLGITDHVIVVTGDAVGRDIWVDSVLVDSRAPLNGFGPDGTGGGVALGVYNNNGTPSTFFGGRLYAALGVNRRVTPAEITSRVTPQFQRTYQ